MKRIFGFLLISVCITSCLFSDFTEDENSLPNNEGLHPIYETLSLEDIYNKEPQEYTQLGNIVLYNDLIFIVENNVGVHVIDNTSPTSPQDVTFINIKSVKQITIDDNVLFSNYGSDLVLIDIANVLNIQLIDVIEDFYSNEMGFDLPEQYVGPFTCVDPKNGYVIGWDTIVITDPKCWR